MEVIKKGSQRTKTGLKTLRASKFVVISFYFITSRIILLSLTAAAPPVVSWVILLSQAMISPRGF
jgi:hypothetical protein